MHPDVRGLRMEVFTMNALILYRTPERLAEKSKTCWKEPEVIQTRLFMGRFIRIQ
jgi:hypothetical protein